MDFVKRAWEALVHTPRAASTRNNENISCNTNTTSSNPHTSSDDCHSCEYNIIFPKNIGKSDLNIQ